MRLLVDTSQVRFTVSKLPEEKKDLDGKQRSDRRTGELLYTVQLVAFDTTGGEVITVTVAGSSPKVTDRNAPRRPSTNRSGEDV